jgi:hypothetical protein
MYLQSTLWRHEVVPQPRCMQCLARNTADGAGVGAAKTKPPPLAPAFTPASRRRGRAPVQGDPSAGASTAAPRQPTGVGADQGRQSTLGDWNFVAPLRFPAYTTRLRRCRPPPPGRQAVGATTTAVERGRGGRGDGEWMRMEGRGGGEWIWFHGSTHVVGSGRATDAGSMCSCS